MERTCPHCQKPFEATEAKCPHCGNESQPWQEKSGRWWMQRGDRWWLRDEATGTWKPYAGAGGIEPESIDSWAILEAMKVQTALLTRIAFWVTLFGVLTVIGIALWVVVLVSLGTSFT